MLSGLAEKTLARKWVAGPSIQDAIKRAKALNALEMSPILNYLGEGFRDDKDVADAVSTYLQLLKAIKKSKVDASISLKASQLGLMLGKRTAYGNYSKIVNEARRQNVFVWLDMESHDTVDATLSMYEKQVGRRGVGVCIQAYLRRSEKDLERLAKKRAVVRLVKGAYHESKRIAFEKRKEVESNYLLLMKLLFKSFGEFTIATHDSGLISEAMLLNRSYRRNVTYAVLLGIRNGYAARLARDRNGVAVYTPFGARWVDYAYRRTRELSHVILFLRSLLGG